MLITENMIAENKKEKKKNSLINEFGLFELFHTDFSEILVLKIKKSGNNKPGYQTK